MMTHGISEDPQVCPKCGGLDLVRVYRPVVGLRSHRARCLSCGHRFAVSRAAHRELRYADLGEPFETWVDRFNFTFHAPMTGKQVGVTVVGAVLGAVLVFYTRRPSFVLFAMIVAWWLGRLLFPYKSSRSADNHVVQGRE